MAQTPGAKSGLRDYQRKRNFQRTPEPSGQRKRAPAKVARSPAASRYVIQKHAARNLHYDLRLERDGVFKSWAVPKGPSLEPGEKRLAVRVEDHPLEYGDFEGVIPKGEYGAGTVMLWDRGQWAPFGAKKAARGRTRSNDDHLDFVLVGEKLRGAWSLVRMSGRASKDGDNWLLIKRHDSAERLTNGGSHVTDVSVATGRTMKQIATDRNRTWTRDGADGVPAMQRPDPKSLPGARKRPLPRSFAPELATLVREAPAGDGWLHEIKFDGYRIVAICDRGEVRLISRNGKDWTRRFPQIASLLRNLAAKKALLDGEVVALNAGGTSSFRALQEALSAGHTAHLIYQAFDLMHLDGYDLTAVPLETRKRTLSELLAASGFTSSSGVRYTEHLRGQGASFVENACRLGLEGIICKHADARYRCERTRDWLKVKCTAREEQIICGYTDPGGARSGFGALLLGAHKGDRLVYTGKVGTGFSERDLSNLSKRLRALRVDTTPVVNPPRERGVHWVRPQLVAEIEFTEWTRDGALRHPVFLGLREDRSAEEIHLPQGMPVDAAAKTARAKTNTRAKSNKSTARRGDSVEVAGVTLTNPDRILFPEQGITKLALAQYYLEIENWILPQLALRPLSLVRCPQGYGKECFFQKHPRSTMAKGTPRLQIKESQGTAPYLYVRELRDVIALVQFGALELHVWGSRVDDVEHPDILVFDLDPAPEVRLTELLRVAKALRSRLEDLGLHAFVRTTGGKGLHLVVPIVPQRNWDEVKTFCQAVANEYAREDPGRITANMAKAKRKGRIFVDYLRNGRGATAIASYSTRARSEAPVAVPVAWDELNAALRPDRYTVENLRRRLAVLRSDPWQDFESARQRLTPAMFRAVGIRQ